MTAANNGINISQRNEAMKYEIVINGASRSVEFTPPANGSSRVKFKIDGRQIAACAVPVSPVAYSILLDGRSLEVTIEESSNGLTVRVNGREFQAQVVDPRSWRRAHGAGVELEGRQQLVAPMPGKIVRVLAAVGQKVSAGEGLLVIEAMKMQNEIRSPKSGTVEKLAREGQTVNAGEILAVVG
ncbi:MAG TPA: biotin/lipoyl-containing protein [Candidatus Saccharimonadales bacterium]|nr:biotin/lipoyl-containing protein [Candidatus Saccharimonadales bacterium]